MGAAANDGGPQPKTPEPAQIILMLSGFALIVIGKIRQRTRAKASGTAESGTIETRAEYPDLRSEKLAGHASR